MYAHCFQFQTVTDGSRQDVFAIRLDWLPHFSTVAHTTQRPGNNRGSDHSRRDRDHAACSWLCWNHPRIDVT
jgi:hypothetical protein